MIYGALTKPPRFLTLQEVLTLHENAIDAFGGAQGLRDSGLLEAALAMPAQTSGSQYLHGVPFGMAAAYVFHIAKNHPFNDGNKRTALSAGVVFLDLNGWRLDVPDLEAADQVLALIDGSSSKESLSAWLESHARPRPSIELRDFFAGIEFERVMAMAASVVAAGRIAEADATTREAAHAIPMVETLALQASACRSAGDESGFSGFNSMGILLVALHRIAEDMGYEW